MSYKEEIKSLVESLEKHGLDRRKIEIELFLSKGYLDQQISKEGNPKIVASLKMLLKLKDLEKAIEEYKKMSVATSPGNEQLHYYDDILNRIDKKVDNVNAVVSDGMEHLILTESLSRTLLYHSAHMEQRHFGGDYDKIAEELFGVTSTIYKKFRNSHSDGQKNKVA